MSPRIASLLVGTVIALFVAGGLVLASHLSAPPPAKGSFSLPRLGGGPRVSLPVVGEGANENVVLTFFASWCGPCHTELPMVAKIASSTKAPVAFVGVDGNDDPAAGLAFARWSRVNFPVAIDSYSEVEAKFGLLGYPATLLLRSDGTVIHAVRGPISAQTLQSWLGR